jgi:hypothetical protein
VTASTDEKATDQEPTEEPHRRRVVLRRVLTVLAGLLVFAALVIPRQVDQLTPLAFVRIPVEGLVAVAVLLVLPPRPRRVVAAVVGALLGVLTIIKIIDMGFLATLDRPFDPVLDWSLVGDAYNFVHESFGGAAAVGAAVLACVLVVVVMVVMTVAALRLSGLLTGRRGPVTKGLAVLSVIWLGAAVLGAQLVDPVPFASRGVAALAYQDAQQIPVSLRDRAEFEAQASVDAFAATPPNQLLTALKGKDVVLTFVESYGRSAVEDPRYAPVVDAALDQGTQALKSAGFAARSGYLTSPVAGGGSWLAHATFGSGLWIANQQRDHSLTSSDRLTLSSAFQKAGWDTTAVMPGTISAWPDRNFYGIDRVYGRDDLGYKGLNFSWSPMPDQYTLAQFQQREYGKPGRSPMMAEVVLTSSHVPWTPVPKLVDWSAVGDGSGYDALVRAAPGPDVVWRDTDKVRAGYRDSIVYSVGSLVDWVKTYGKDNLVLVFLGDHQPAPIITGDGASHDVPITIVAKDPTVLDKIADWGWSDGIRPAPGAPVWKMDAFRDRFLSAFGQPAAPVR